MSQESHAALALHEQRDLAHAQLCTVPTLPQLLLLPIGCCNGTVTPGWVLQGASGPQFGTWYVRATVSHSSSSPGVCSASPHWWRCRDGGCAGRRPGVRRVARFSFPGSGTKCGTNCARGLAHGRSSSAAEVACVECPYSCTSAVAGRWHVVHVYVSMLTKDLPARREHAVCVPRSQWICMALLPQQLCLCHGYKMQH